MIDDIKSDAAGRMDKSLESVQHTFARIRTGRANPALLEGIQVQYYGTETPLNQVSTISVEDGRTLAEFELNEKNRISHRARAMAACLAYLVERRDHG